MAAYAGERAEETGDFHRAHCGEVVHVTVGDTDSECPNGHSESDRRTGRSGTKG